MCVTRSMLRLRQRGTQELELGRAGLGCSRATAKMAQLRSAIRKASRADRLDGRRGSRPRRGSGPARRPWPANRTLAGEPGSRAPATRSSRRCSNAAVTASAGTYAEQLVRQLAVGAGEHRLGGRRVRYACSVRPCWPGARVARRSPAAHRRRARRGAGGPRWSSCRATAATSTTFASPRRRTSYSTLRWAAVTGGGTTTPGRSVSGCDIDAHEPLRTLASLVANTARVTGSASLVSRRAPEDQVDVAELVPPIPCRQRRPVRELQGTPAGDRLEHLQVAGLRARASR